MASLAAGDLRRGLDLPPPYTLVSLRERGDAFAHACAIAGESGAGTLVHVGRFDLAEFAVVLEPEAPLRLAGQAFVTAMAALADAVEAHAPPEKAVGIGWPDSLNLDGARLGGGRLGWPEDCPPDAVPDWLVFSATLVAAPIWLTQEGLVSGLTSLEEEGVLDGRQIVESFARHLMLHLDSLADRGFRFVAGEYASRVPRARAADRLRLDEEGNLLIQGLTQPEPERHSLWPALRQPSWLDPATGELST